MVVVVVGGGGGGGEDGLGYFFDVVRREDALSAGEYAFVPAVLD